MVFSPMPKVFLRKLGYHHEKNVYLCKEQVVYVIDYCSSCKTSISFCFQIQIQLFSTSKSSPCRETLFNRLKTVTFLQNQEVSFQII